MGAETSCCSAADGYAVALAVPDERQLKKVFKQYCDSHGEVPWEDIVDCIDDLPGWDGCGERWAEEELDKWKSKKKGKPVNLKLFSRIVQGALETQQEWNSSPLGAETRRGKSRGSSRQRKQAAKYEKMSRAELKKLCKTKGLKTGSTEEMVARLTKAVLNEDASSDSDSDSDSEQEMTQSQKKLMKKLAKEALTEQQLRKKLKKAKKSQLGDKAQLVRRLARSQDADEGTSAEEDSSGSSNDSDSDSSSTDSGTSDPRRSSRSASPRSRGKSRSRSRSASKSPTKKLFNKFEALDLRELKDLCKRKRLNSSGSHSSLVKRLVEAEAEEVGGALREEKDPDRRRLREKYEKKSQVELQRILKDARKTPHGTKEQLVDRILDWKMPKDSDTDSDTDDSSGHKSPRKSLKFGGESSGDDGDERPSLKSVRAKYNAMNRSQLKKMCRESWLEADGDKEDLIARLVDYEKPAEGWGSGGSPKKRGKEKKAKKSSGGGMDLWGDESDEETDSSDSSDDDRTRRRERKEAEAKLAPLDRKRLQQLCGKNKLKDTGSSDDMRKRLLKHVMENKDLGDDSSSDAETDGEVTYESVREKFDGMTRSQLRKLCKDTWLSEDGDTEELIERLVDYEKPEGGWKGSSDRRKGRRKSDGDETPRQREKRKRKKYDGMAFDALKDLCREFGLSPQGTRERIVDRLVEEGPSDDEDTTDEDDGDEAMAEWRRKDRKLRSRLAKEPTHELRKLCRDKSLNPTGSDEVMIDRIVKNDLPKPEPQVVEDNPARRALRAKYENMKIFELQRYLQAEGADRNGTKEQLIVRLLDRQCPDDGTLHRTPSHTPRAMADEGLKYNRMELHELRILCRENGLSTTGSKKDLVHRLVDASAESPRGGSPRSRSASPGLSLEPVSEELDGRELRRQARAKYDTMTLSQLQATCEQSWVDASGSREEMIERLIHYEASTNDWPPDKPSPRPAGLGLFANRSSSRSPPATSSRGGFMSRVGSLLSGNTGSTDI